MTDQGKPCPKCGANGVALFGSGPETWMCGSQEYDNGNFAQHINCKNADLEKQVAELTDSSYESMLQELEQQVDELTADNAARQKVLIESFVEIGDECDVCKHCEEVVSYDWRIPICTPICTHKPDCIITADHPGSVLLERLEAADKVMDDIDSLPKATMRTVNTDYNRVTIQSCVLDRLYELRAAYSKTKEKKP